MAEQSGKRPKYESPRTSEVPEDPGEFAGAVGERIRSARQERGWTQAELAERAALSVNYVARLERGELGPSLFVAHRIAEALRVTLEELVSARPVRRSDARRRM